MIQVYGAYLSRCAKEHPDAAFGSRFIAWGQETAARRIIDGAENTLNAGAGQKTGGQRTAVYSINAGSDRIRYSAAGQAGYDIRADCSGVVPDRVTGRM